MSQTLAAPITEQTSDTSLPRQRGGSGGDEPPRQSTRTRQPRRRRRRVLVIVIAALLILLGIPAAAALYVGHQLNGQIKRVHGVFDNLPNRPTKPTTGAAAKAQNILLLGTDRRSDVPTTGSSAKASEWVPGQQRSDTMMVLHIDADRRGASVISIPRDSWVKIPGHGMAKINAAYSWGGPRLAVETVEQLTNVRIDHVAIVDWDGYKAMINKLGGIDVTIPKTVYDSARKYTWTAGTHHLNGGKALLYARERHGLPGGDLDRVKRQQAVLRALSQKALAATGSPTATYKLLNSLTKHLSIDDTWSGTHLTKLALSLRHLQGSEVAYLTAPVRGTGMEGAQSVVYLNPTADSVLWKALQEDKMSAWSENNRDRLTGNVVD